VLALLPAHEGQGVGRQLLARVVDRLLAAGHGRLFLGCSADPASRSHGFYRHLGWRSTGSVDAHGDEVLEYAAGAPA
jgi:GNAT superfamily N-acetyltransferase